jgi:TetR/AcrR family transcriptional regulator, mexJK operon transcriptional repressor
MNTAEAPAPVARKRGRPPRETSGILEAAVAVFAREGYSAATIEMIAGEAAASTATLYKRFTNKHGLFVAVLEKTTSKSLAVHVKNRAETEHAFSALLSKLEAHALVSSDPEVRGVMRAWVSEVRSHSELAELFAVNSSRELVAGLINQMKKLQDQGLIKLPIDDIEHCQFGAQIMLGITERFTLTRGLVLGDKIKPMYSARGIAEKSVHALVGIYGTPEGIAAFAEIPKVKLRFEG